ncbi:MAG: phosphoribosylaminoimidazolesuccinocarboxamide synthase, partial [Candidatus Hermodarchaeota archaeon]
MIPQTTLKEQLGYTLHETNFPQLGDKIPGKVRDNYVRADKRFIITTDRVSTFDRVVSTIPFKGQVLTEMANFWFEKTKDIVKNHVISLPDPNVMVVRECELIPLEMVVRGYITGVTKTSAWYNYQQGVRNLGGNIVPDGLRKDQKFDQPIITPTTKAVHGEHDENVTPEEAIKRGLVTQELWDELSKIALALFDRGTRIAAKQGIILVDTKYEFGFLDDKIVLIDEIHTPDSSRFWFSETYQEKLEKGEEQQKIDKEYLRTWLVEQGFRGDGPIPKILDEVRIKAAQKYIQAYEYITGNEFKAEKGEVHPRIAMNLNKAGYLP